MAFQRLATIAPLVLPIGDKTYTFKPVDADLGLFLTELSGGMAAANEGAEISPEQTARLQDMAAPLGQEDTLARMLGAETLAELKADGHPWPVIQLVAATVMVWTVSGLEAAEEHWNSGGGRGKAPRDRKPKKTAR